MTPRAPRTCSREPGPSRARAAILLAALAVAITGLGACSSVNQGDPPADINACRPSQAFFVSDVFPKFLANNYGGKTCGDASCHDNASGRLLRVFTPSTMTPAVPLAGGSDWDILYRSATEEMICTDVLGGELFTRPAGLQTHGPGRLIDPSPGGPEAMLLQTWVVTRP